MIEETHPEFPCCTTGTHAVGFSFIYSFATPMTYFINVFQYGNMNNLISSICKICSCLAFISLTYVIIDYIILFPSNVLFFCNGLIGTRSLYSLM